jgi:two-component system phosphate regulon sensor histidine kinase PhoR
MTLGSSIFRKLLVGALVLIGVPLLVLDFYLTRYTADREVQSVQHRLLLEARILSGEVPGGHRERLQEWARAAGERAQARITVIDRVGAVLADSQHDLESMENHGGRPEVREAAQGRIGTAIRHDATLRRDLCYLAISLGSSEHPGAVLRLAVPLEELDASVRALRWRILGASVAAAAVALLIAYFFARRSAQRIARLKSFAEGLTESRFSETVPAEPDDEIGALARSLNRMAAQSRELVGRLSLELARRELILDGMVEGVLALDAELQVTFCNRAFAQAFGVSLPIRERLPLLELVRDPGLLDLLKGVLVSGKAVTQRLELAAAAGRSFEIQASPLRNDTRPGAIAILHDITELERLDRVRRDFVANVSHELRTPLTAILGYAETLLDGALEDPENRRKFVEIIQTHAARLNAITSDLLTLSNLESGKSPAAAEPVSVRAAVESALRAVEAEARERAVSLVCERLEEAEVLGERLHLEQVVLNLLNNAVKFNRPGGEVRIAATRTSDAKIRITVADTGIGIPSEDLPRIFERFYRVDRGRSRAVGGTGLGLSIVKHAVERMGGVVAVESELGRGSTFTVLLPAC